MQELRKALAEQRDLREVFLTMFPNGLTFRPARTPDGSRAIWRIEGAGSFDAVLREGSGGGTLPIKARPRRDSNPCYLRERRVS